MVAREVQFKLTKAFEFQPRLFWDSHQTFPPLNSVAVCLFKVQAWATPCNFVNNVGVVTLHEYSKAFCLEERSYRQKRALAQIYDRRTPYTSNGFKTCPYTLVLHGLTLNSSFPQSWNSTHHTVSKPCVASVLNGPSHAIFDSRYKSIFRIVLTDV